MTEREEDTLSEREYQMLKRSTLLIFNTQPDWTSPELQEGDVIKFLGFSDGRTITRKTFEIVKSHNGWQHLVLQIDDFWEVWNQLEFA